MGSGHDDQYGELRGWEDKDVSGWGRGASRGRNGMKRFCIENLQIVNIKENNNVES